MQTLRSVNTTFRVRSNAASCQVLELPQIENHRERDTRRATHWLDPLYSSLQAKISAVNGEIH